MKGFTEWLRKQNGPVLEAGVGKAILVLTSALIAAKVLPEWARSVGEALVLLLGWI